MPIQQASSSSFNGTVCLLTVVMEYPGQVLVDVRICASDDTSVAVGAKADRPVSTARTGATAEQGGTPVEEGVTVAVPVLAGVNPVLGVAVAVPLAEEVLEACAPVDRVAVCVPEPVGGGVPLGVTLLVGVLDGVAEGST